MESKAPAAGPIRLPSKRGSSKLPLYLLRHGCSLIGFGLLYGLIVPLTPYPRLALTAHIQFAAEGTMVLAAGLLLQSDPFNGTRPLGDSGEGTRIQLADRLGYWQKRAVYWSLAGIWITLGTEAANGWWGTKWMLPLAFQAAGLSGEPAAWWMEVVLAAAHLQAGLSLNLVWPIILSALW